MSAHPIAYRVETEARSYMAASVPTVTVRGSEHLGQIREPRAVFVVCETASGIECLPGNADMTIRVEVHTNLALYSSFTTAVTDHYTLCGTVFDFLMMDDLITQLDSTGVLTIQGVKSGETQTQRRDGWTLVNTMSRTVRGVPQ